MSIKEMLSRFNLLKQSFVKTSQNVSTGLNQWIMYMTRSFTKCRYIAIRQNFIWYHAKSRMYRCVFEMKCPLKTRQFREIWFQQLLHKQISKRGTNMKCISQCIATFTSSHCTVHFSFIPYHVGIAFLSSLRPS